MTRVLNAILEFAAGCGVGKMLVDRETVHRFKASVNGVEYLGSYEGHGIALFRDPVTGSSFAVRENEAVEAGIARVRTRFGLT